jgi:hypothetical protein
MKMAPRARVRPEAGARQAGAAVAGQAGERVNGSSNFHEWIKGLGLTALHGSRLEGEAGRRLEARGQRRAVVRGGCEDRVGVDLRLQHLQRGGEGSRFRA